METKVNFYSSNANVTILILIFNLAFDFNNNLGMNLKFIEKDVCRYESSNLQILMGFFFNFLRIRT